VIELDPHVAGACNNLGNLLADSNDPDNTLDAFRHALQLTPDDPKLPYNLANLLDTIGLGGKAKTYWQAYLRYDPADSAWAEHARERLRAPA
jgi:tetratricopeptide (TPR) repeat protein